MRGVALTEENLHNQVEVVKEEIRVNVLNRPYGGFPWLLLPPVLFDTFPNAHNGYGDFVDLESATVADAQAFFDRYYAPGNAVLTVAGDFDPDEALRLVERHFGDIPAPRRCPPRPTSPSRRRTASGASRARDRAGAAAGGRDRLAGARPGRPRRLPALRGARRGAHRRRRVPPGGAAGAARPHGDQHRRLPRASWATRSTSATPRRCCCRRTTRPAATPTRCCDRRRGARPARHRRAEPRRAGPHRGPDAAPATCARSTRCSAGRWRWPCSSSSAAAPSWSTSCPGCSPRSPRRSQAAAATLRRRPRRARDPARRAPHDRRPAEPDRFPPSAGPGRPELPTVAERTLANGLRVLAVRRPGRAAGRAAAAGAVRRAPARRPRRPRAAARRDAAGRHRPAHRRAVAAELQALGGSLSAGTDPDRLRSAARCSPPAWPGCSSCSPRCSPARPTPSDEVAGERDRLVQDLAIHRSQPASSPARHCCARMYGDHPYGRDLPERRGGGGGQGGGSCAACTPSGSPRTAASWCWSATSPRPGRSTPPRRRWPAGRRGRGRRAPPLPAAAGRARRCCVDRPGAVQSSLRIGGPAPPAPHPDHAAFSWPTWSSAATSRRAGWRTSARTRATPTARTPASTTRRPAPGSPWPPTSPPTSPRPALLETWYELGRIATLPVGQDELDQARRYAIGTLALSTASQAGLASTLSALTAGGLGRGVAARLAEGPGGGDRRRGPRGRRARYLRRPRLTAVLVGDAEQVEAPASRVLSLVRGPADAVA